MALASRTCSATFCIPYHMYPIYPRNISKYHEPHKCVQPNLAQRATFKKATTGHFETCLRLHDLIEFLMPEGQRSTHSWSLIQGPFSLRLNISNNDLQIILTNIINIKLIKSYGKIGSNSMLILSARDDVKGRCLYRYSIGFI